MQGITWIDARGTIPQPLRADDAAHGDRRVEARLWHTAVAPKPYKVEFRLLDAGVLVETWNIWHLTGLGFSHATRVYEDTRLRTERWLNGTATIASIRPGKKWTVEKSGAP